MTHHHCRQYTVEHMPVPICFTKVIHGTPQMQSRLSFINSDVRQGRIYIGRVGLLGLQPRAPLLQVPAKNVN